MGGPISAGVRVGARVGPGDIARRGSGKSTLTLCRFIEAETRITRGRVPGFGSA
jgi:hypothetical protein